MNYNIIVIIAIIWIAINSAHILLKLLLANVYTALLHSLGVSLKPYKISINITSLNRIIYIIGNWGPKFVNKWFAVGTVASLALALPAVYIVITTIFNFVFTNSNDSLNVSKTQSLYPVIPGINLPLSDFSYYFISLAICSFYHEFGHALAAVREGVRIYSYGLFILVIIPGASVDLSTEQVLNLKVWNQLKIFTAGVWHNINLAIFAIILLLLNPFILSPFYTQHEGAVLAHIEAQSGAAGPNGLRHADLITGVNGCKVIDESNWKICLASIASHPQTGYCVNDEFVNNARIFVSDPSKCCDHHSDRGLCFKSVNSEEMMCLTVRQLLDKSPSTCNSSIECIHMFDKSYYCVKPISQYNGTKLIQIKRQGKPSVLFWGFPSELFQSTVLINYKPKMKWLPLLYIHYYETLLRYIISFSLALAVLNVIPCHHLDGQWILNAFIEFALNTKVSIRCKKIISNIVIGIGTLLLTCCVCLGLYQLLKL